MKIHKIDSVISKYVVLAALIVSASALGFQGKGRFEPTPEWLQGPHEVMWPNEGVVRSKCIAIQLGAVYLRSMFGISDRQLKTLQAKQVGNYWIVYPLGPEDEMTNRALKNDNKYVRIDATNGGYLGGGYR